MSKLYQMNRMRYSAAAGGMLSTAVLGAGKLLSKLFQSKAARAAAALAKKVAQNPLAQTAAVVGAGEVAGALLGGSKKSGGASGGWTTRRRKGITGNELKGFHKVARLLHREGMVIKHHKRGR